MLGERDKIGEYLAQVGLISAVFCVLSLALGYLLAKALGLTEREATAVGFEIGVHNTTLAIAMALTVLGVAEMAVPPAVYGVLMFPLALGFGFLTSVHRSRLSRSARRT